MRRFSAISVIFIFVFLILGFVWSRQSNVDKLQAEYQKIVPFSVQEMRFSGVSKTVFGDGLVFYQPIFPQLPLRIKADYIQLQATPIEVKMYLSGVVADIAQTLLARDGTDLADTLRSFSPPGSFITQPLETFVLLNRDIFKGSVSLNLRPYGENVQLTLSLYQKGKEMIRLRTTIRQVPDNRLWSWTDGSVQIVTLSIFDKDLGISVANYYRSIQKQIPAGLQQLIMNGKPYYAVIHLDTPVKVSDLLNRF